MSDRKCRGEKVMANDEIDKLILPMSTIDSTELTKDFTYRLDDCPDDDDDDDGGPGPGPGPGPGGSDDDDDC
jgi:hypothetical protein